MSQKNFEQSYFAALTTVFNITEDDNVVAFSIAVESGTCTIQGSGTYGGQPSGTITLSEGGTYTVMSSQGAFLKGYVITPIGGTTNIDVRK